MLWRTPDDDRALLKFLVDIRNHENDMFWKKISAFFVIIVALLAFLGVAAVNDFSKMIVLLALLTGTFIMLILYFLSSVDNAKIDNLDYRISELSKKMFQESLFEKKLKNNKMRYYFESNDTREYIPLLSLGLMSIQLMVALFVWTGVKIPNDDLFPLSLIVGLLFVCAVSWYIMLKSHNMI